MSIATKLLSKIGRVVDESENALEIHPDLEARYDYYDRKVGAAVTDWTEIEDDADQDDLGESSIDGDVVIDQRIDKLNAMMGTAGDDWTEVEDGDGEETAIAIDVAMGRIDPDMLDYSDDGNDLDTDFEVDAADLGGVYVDIGTEGDFDLDGEAEVVVDGEDQIVGDSDEEDGWESDWEFETDESVQVETNEARGSDYKLYHKTYSDAVQTALQYVRTKHKLIEDEDDYFQKVTVGSKRPSSGKTNSFIIALRDEKTGQPSRKSLHMQIYNMDDKAYELNMYVESMEDLDLLEGKSAADAVEKHFAALDKNLKKADLNKAIVIVKDGLPKLISVLKAVDDIAKIIATSYLAFRNGEMTRDAALADAVDGLNKRIAKREDLSAHESLEETSESYESDVLYKFQAKNNCEIRVHKADRGVWNGVASDVTRRVKAMKGELVAVCAPKLSSWGADDMAMVEISKGEQSWLKKALKQPVKDGEVVLRYMSLVSEKSDTAPIIKLNWKLGYVYFGDANKNNPDDDSEIWFETKGTPLRFLAMTDEFLKRNKFDLRKHYDYLVTPKRYHDLLDKEIYIQSNEDSVRWSKNEDRDALAHRFPTGQSVKDVTTGLVGTVIHLGNRDEVFVKFGSINKAVKASNLRLQEDFDVEEGDMTHLLSMLVRDLDGKAQSLANHARKHKGLVSDAHVKALMSAVDGLSKDLSAHESFDEIKMAQVLGEAYTKDQLKRLRLMLGRDGQLDKKIGVGIFMDKVGVDKSTATSMWKAATEAKSKAYFMSDAASEIAEELNEAGEKFQINCESSHGIDYIISVARGIVSVETDFKRQNGWEVGTGRSNKLTDVFPKGWNKPSDLIAMFMDAVPSRAKFEKVFDKLGADMTIVGYYDAKGERVQLKEALSLGVDEAAEESVEETDVADMLAEAAADFMFAAAKAKVAGETEFEFEGETYPVTMKQDSAEDILKSAEGKKESLDDQPVEARSLVGDVTAILGEPSRTGSPHKDSVVWDLKDGSIIHARDSYSRIEYADKRGDLITAYTTAKQMQKALSQSGLIESVDVEEAVDEAAPKISTGTAKGNITATGMRGKGMKKFDVDVKVVSGKFEFRIKDEQGKFQTVGLKKAARMLGESVEPDEAKQVHFIVMPLVEKGKIKKWHSAEVRASSAKEAREKGAMFLGFGLKPNEVEAVVKYPDDAHMIEELGEAAMFFGDDDELGSIKPADIKKVAKGQRKYPMSLVGDDIQAMLDYVDQYPKGIKSRSSGGRLNVEMDAGALEAFLMRANGWELSDELQDLAGSVVETLKEYMQESTRDSRHCVGEAARADVDALFADADEGADESVAANGVVPSSAVALISAEDDDAESSDDEDDEPTEALIEDDINAFIGSVFDALDESDELLSAELDEDTLNERFERIYTATDEAFSVASMPKMKVSAIPDRLLKSTATKLRNQILKGGTLGDEVVLLSKEGDKFTNVEVVAVDTLSKSFTDGNHFIVEASDDDSDDLGDAVDSSNP